MSVAPPVGIIRKQKLLIAAFREAAATSPERAKTLSELVINAGLARISHRAVRRAEAT
jgi:hypothetical protein